MLGPVKLWLNWAMTRQTQGLFRLKCVELVSLV
jgi:hypothetical protein